MRILAVDTSTLSCGVAVTGPEGLLSEGLFTSNQTHSRHLLSMISETVERAGLSVGDLGGFAVTCGPGSFTGLRIGMSVVKSLAETCDAKVAGVPTLEALAEGARLAGLPVLSMLDARKGEVYAALYEPMPDGTLQTVIAPNAFAPEALLDQISGEILCVGTGVVSYRDLINRRLGERAHISPAHDTIRPSVVAALGVKIFEEGRAVDPAGLVPIYLRKSDAEIDLEKRMAAEGHE